MSLPLPMSAAEIERVAVVLALLRAMAERDHDAVRVLLATERDLAWSVGWVLLGFIEAEIAPGDTAEWIGRHQAEIRELLADC